MALRRSLHDSMDPLIELALHAGNWEDLDTIVSLENYLLRERNIPVVLFAHVKGGKPQIQIQDTPGSVTTEHLRGMLDIYRLLEEMLT